MIKSIYIHYSGYNVRKLHRNVLLFLWGNFMSLTQTLIGYRFAIYILKFLDLSNLF